MAPADRLGLDYCAAGTNPVVQRALVWVKKEDAPGKGSVRVMADGQPAGADTYAFASTDAPPNKGYLLGTRLNDTARCTPVEVFEVILYDRALNDSESEALNRYLQRK